MNPKKDEDIGEGWTKIANIDIKSNPHPLTKMNVARALLSSAEIAKCFHPKIQITINNSSTISFTSRKWIADLLSVVDETKRNLIKIIEVTYPSYADIEHLIQTKYDLKGFRFVGDRTNVERLQAKSWHKVVGDHKARIVKILQNLRRAFPKHTFDPHCLDELPDKKDCPTEKKK